jgi:soluble lytic murein transglycosylase-like protein
VRSATALPLAAAVLVLGAERAPAQVFTRVNGNGVVEATNVPAAPGFRLTYPGKGTLIHSRGFQRARASSRLYDSQVEDASRLFQVSSDLVKAVIAAESEFDQWAVSSKGARGLMQLMPATARRLGVRDSFDARQNIMGGTQYLREMLDQFQGDVTLALAAYNAGPNAVLRYGGIPPYKETRGYVSKIQSLLGGFTATAAPSSAAAAYYTPSSELRQAPVPVRISSPPSAPKRPSPARPATYYRWRDERGVTHVAEAPPAEGTVFQVVRALD